MIMKMKLSIGTVTVQETKNQQKTNTQSVKKDYVMVLNLHGQFVKTSMILFKTVEKRKTKILSSCKRLFYFKLIINI